MDPINTASLPRHRAEGAAGPTLAQGSTPAAVGPRPLRVRLTLTVVGFGTLTLATCVLAPLIVSGPRLCVTARLPVPFIVIAVAAPFV